MTDQTPTEPLSDQRLTEIEHALGAVTTSRPRDHAQADSANARWSVGSTHYAADLVAEIRRLRGELGKANDAITAAVHRLQREVPPLQAERDQLAAELARLRRQLDAAEAAPCPHDSHHTAPGDTAAPIRHAESHTGARGPQRGPGDAEPPVTHRSAGTTGEPVTHTGHRRNCLAPDCAEAELRSERQHQAADTMQDLTLGALAQDAEP